MQGLKEFKTHRMVKSEDVNHHGTFYAGRCAEWFVESGFVAATSCAAPQNLVCLKIYGMHFKKPVRMGDVVCYTSKIAYAGSSSVMIHVNLGRMNGESEEQILDGFISFVHVDENTKPTPHGIEIHPHTPEDIELYERAKRLKEQK